MLTEMSQKIENEVFSFLQEAGKLALTMRDSADNYTKEDGSIVTDVDLAISKLFRNNFAHYLSHDDHFLVDEESIEDTNAHDILNKNYKYIWTLDPVDGTAPFASDLPLWGISVGILKDHKPWMGFIYQPEFNTFFIHNGTDFYSIKNGKKKLYKKNELLNPKGKNFIYTNFFKTVHNNHKFAIDLQPYSAALVFPWIATGGLRAGVLKSRYLGGLWDWAMAWPMLQHTGKEFRSVETGEVINSIDNFLTPNWKKRINTIVSDEKDFKELKQIIQFDE